MEVISSERRDLFHFQVAWIRRQQQCKCGWKSMLCMSSSALAASMATQWSEFLTFHPAWWWCNHRMGCWWNWCWLQPAAFHPRSPLVRESHKRVCAQAGKKKKMSRHKENFPFCFCGKALKIKYCTHFSNSHNGTSQLPSVSRRLFHWEWVDNEIKKLHFAFALIKKRGFIFSITGYKRPK